MTHVKIKDKLIPATITGQTRDYDWGDRDSKTIHCTMTYEEAVATFSDGLDWSIVYQGPAYPDENGEMITPPEEVYDNSDYCVAGPITDNRDGTVSVKMGKMTAQETLNIILGGEQV